VAAREAQRLNAKPMRFAISVPQVVADGSFDPAGLRAYLAQAEELGFESAWTGEQVLGTLPLLSPLETLAYAAACTRRIRLGCAMFVSSLHNPVHLAKAIASLDQLSGGRAEIGLVTGGPFRMFSAFEVDPASFVARFGEGLQLMKQLWTQPRVDFDGRFWQLRDAAMEPKPLQRPHPPIWLGGSHPNALRRSVRLGQGFVGAGSSTTAQFAQHAGTVRAELRQQRCDPSCFTIAKRVYIAVDDDGEAARSRITDALHRRYSYFGLDNLAAVAVAGTVDDCISGLRDIAAAGAHLILLDPLFDEIQQMRRLANDVIPHLL
jgi:alkanesulfonate monooxygenase SsuD/methylene tetrahydromethanopterin reductase-like flavin-dependent oxidoreductase (luciferase family)